MSTWIARPTDPAPRRWHLMAVLPPENPLVYAACGLAFVPFDHAPLERAEDADTIPESVRCEDYQRVFSGRLQGWI